MKCIKNDTQSSIYISELGFNLPPGYNHTIALAELSEWQYSEQVLSQITNGNFVVNDGTTFYTDVEEAISFLRN